MVTYSPAEAAAASGFSIDTLRYYEKEGIVGPVSRTGSGRRAYSDADLGWLDLVRCLRDTGMPIADLKRYARLSREEGTLGERLALLEVHDVRVQEAIDALCAQRARIREKIAWYHEQGV